MKNKEEYKNIEDSKAIKIIWKVDQIKSKQTSLLGGILDHQITRKGLNEQIF